ncbi:alanine--tRNA ligase [Egicoccus halophilus]|uniref:Alanine--tRNA ligase n=1 Tax=Egicoccus halophilus TaxID=1670830 RepID=A0A8J3ABD1_9ACTN|nr:alanine--tRNA ligase [Egicoccus halophilus]GGI07339.1 alanine--tRNA ligase [Egicoccus halophilus]
MDSLSIRNTFLDFFVEHGHRRYESASLIPQDPTVLLTIAGMLPFKPWFMGDATPPTPRATSYQKCARTNDIENVGHTTRHLTFFEMLGNFSFGDYFKREAIRWAWALSVEHYRLDPERIWVTVYEDDDEAEQLWLAETDIPAARIQRLGAEDNYWWTHAAGPGGPNTELYYDRGEAYGHAGGPAVDDERYLEFYNLVFMQHELDDAGNVLGQLPALNVDTGLGLERMAVLLQGVDNVFETDLFAPLLARAGELSGTAYGEDAERDVSLRVIAEHARTSAFLIADGVLPSKEGRGYVLRRLMRRAVRHGQLLGMDIGSSGQQLLLPMVEQVIEQMRPSYPDLERQRSLITRVAGAEETDFGARIRQGLERVDQAITSARSTGDDAPAFPGEVAFELHDTFGFPIDLTAEIAADAGLSLDRGEFDALMQQQRERARAAAKKGSGGIPAETYREAAAQVGTTDFLGYRGLTAEAELGAIVTAGGLLHTAGEGDEVEIVLPRTPFYAEGGGQVGDVGLLETPTGRLQVTDTQEAIEGLIVHRARVVAGEVRQGQPVEAHVDPSRRVATARSHSATHVLHATIKEFLGDHAQQAGSLVQPGRLRFDFPHFESVSRDRLAEIEGSINERVLRDPHVHTEVMSLDDAKKSGAVANFGDKYGQVVRVVTIGEFSKELCGGTHVPSGAKIGTITIVREESIGSNTRRIEALTGVDAFGFLSKERMVAEEIARLVDVPSDQAVERVGALLDRLKAAEKELAKLRGANLSQEARRIADEASREDGLAVVVTRADGLAHDDLRRLATEIRNHLAERAVIVVGTATDEGKAQLICAVSADLAAAGVEARPILHPAAQVVGGGAGGKGDLAQAGGKQGDRLDEALQVAAGEARAAAAASR